MVELEEVKDADLHAPQPGPQDEDEDSADFTDTDSSISTTSNSPPFDETITERLLALRDMLPPSTRRRISSVTSQLTNFVKSGAHWSGKGIWILSTSALMVGIPWVMAFVDEQSMIEMEAERQAREVAGEVINPGASTGGQKAGAAL